MLLTLAATGCGGGSARIAERGAAADWCATHRMIVLGPGEVDRLDQDTVDRLLEENERGQIECGWVPPGDEP